MRYHVRNWFLFLNLFRNKSHVEVHHLRWGKVIRNNIYNQQENKLFLFFCEIKLFYILLQK